MTELKPFRITSGGYNDGEPTVSPTGDKIFFLSNRPNRDTHSLVRGFVMSIPIDKTTGKPNGPIRQVTTDSLTFLPANGISPDGKLFAYNLLGTPSTLRLVSTAGGNARVLATKFTFGGMYTSFTADGKNVLFQDSIAHLIKQVPVVGGPAIIVRRAPEGELEAPIPNSDGRVMVGMDVTGAYTVLDKTGRSLASIQIPPAFGTAKVLRSDGLGWIGVSNEDSHGIKRVMLSTGAVTDVLAPQAGWPFGVAPDGSIATNYTVNGRVVLSRISPAGAALGKVTTGPEVRWISGLLSGGKNVLAQGFINPHVAKPNQRGVDTAMRTFPAYILDRTTGAARKIADSMIGWCCPQNYGTDEDAVGIGEVHGSMVNIQSIDAGGATHLVRSLSIAAAQRFYQMAVRGIRLAYVDSTGKDQGSIFVTTGPTSPVVRVADLPIAADVEVVLTWSLDGRKLAIVYNDAQNHQRPTARVLEIADNGSLTTVGPALSTLAASVTITRLSDGFLTEVRSS